MNAVEIYGSLAVVAMLLCYALEARGPGWILAFAAACLASSSYAALIRSWPFAAIELLWAGVALRRWSRARASRGPSHDERIL